MGLRPYQVLQTLSLNIAPVYIESWQKSTGVPFFVILLTWTDGRTLICYQKKVYHDRKRHLTWVRCTLITWFYFLYRKLAKQNHWCTVFCYFVDVDGRTDGHWYVIRKRYTHDRKRHLTWVRRTLITWFYFFVPKTGYKNHWCTVFSYCWVGQFLIMLLKTVRIQT